MALEALRTPDARFSDLPDYPYTPHFLDDLPGYEGLRMAFIDEGPRDAPVFFCLHGEPSWGFLYRKMIPIFLEAGGRVVVPDLYGFGRSDKPVDRDDYTYTFHRGSLLSLVSSLGLKNITLVCQDWGGILGLSLPMEAPERYKRLIVMNTGLPIEPASSFVAEDLRRPAAERKTGFGQWHAFSQRADDMPVGSVLNQGSAQSLSPEEIAAYDAPFPDKSYKAGALAFPTLVPFSEEQDGYTTGRQALKFWNGWEGESFMAIGGADPVLGEKAMRALHAEINGCPQPLLLPEAGHFIQEWGDVVARAALESFAG
ncbi:MAG: haloalkane dehalogenase [Pseudomonadota bacterium]